MSRAQPLTPESHAVLLAAARRSLMRMRRPERGEAMAMVEKLAGLVGRMLEREGEGKMREKKSKKE